MNNIPYTYVIAYGIDPTTKDFTVILNYSTFLSLKKEIPYIKNVYKTQHYNKEYLPTHPHLPNIVDYEHYNPQFEEISDELGLWLSLVIDNYS